MSEVLTGGSLVFSELNTPTRKGERINRLEEIYDIPTPFVGMSVWVRDEGCEYVVTSLRDRVVNGVVQPNAGVDTYKRKVDKTDIEEIVKLLGSFNSASEFNNRLNTLTYDAAVSGMNIGFFRAKVKHRDAEVKNILLSSGLNVIVQVVAGTFVSVNNTLTLTDSGYNVFTRKHENGAWSEWLKWNGAVEGGSGGNVSDEQLLAIYTAINAEKARAEEVENSLQAQIMAINLGAKVTISLSPSVVYKETSTSVVITANMSGVTPATLKLTDANGSELGSVSNKSSVSATKTYSLSADMKFNAVAEYSGAQFKGSGTLYARYPIYAGFGVSAAAVAVDANKKSARTSAAGTYSATLSNATGTQNYYILVPNDISALSSFSMGGAPFVMNSSVEKINEIDYKVYKSGGAYGNGASVNIVAS